MRDFSSSELEALDRLNLESHGSPAWGSPLSRSAILEAPQTGLEKAPGNVKSALVDVGLLERKAEETNGIEESKDAATN